MKPRLKIKDSALKWGGDAILYKGEPFTGTAFEERDGLILSAVEVEAGKIVGPYRSTFFEAPEDALHVAEACPDIEGSKDYPEIVQFRYRGEPFNGVYYEFQKEICIYEGLMRKGWAEVQLDWYVSGEVEAYEGPDGEFEFDRGFRLRYLCISKSGSSAIQVSFSEEGRITKLRVLGNILEEMGAVAARLPFQCITQVSDLTSRKAGERLWVVDLGRDGRPLTELLDAACLEETVDLILPDKGLTAGQIARLASLPKLKKLKLYDPERRHDDAILELQKQRPDLKIEHAAIRRAN